MRAVVRQYLACICSFFLRSTYFTHNASGATLLDLLAPVCLDSSLAEEMPLLALEISTRQVM